MKVQIYTGIGFIHFIDAAVALSELGHDVEVISATRHSAVGGVSFRWCPISRTVDLIERKLFRRKYSTLAWRVFGLEARKCLKACDVVLVRSGAGYGLIAAAKNLGLKVVVDHSLVHPDGFARDLGPDYNCEYDFWRQVKDDCRSADVVQVNSELVAKTFLAAGFHSEQVRVLRLGVRLDFCGIRTRRADTTKADGPLKLLFTGRFCARKGCEDILAACRLLKSRGVQFILDVVGADSEGKQYIESRADLLSIRFHGPMSQEQLKPFLASSDIYVFPSRMEGCAQSGMEAMAAGLCVVATEESGLPISDGIDGFLVPSRNQSAVADMLSLLSDKREMIDMVGQTAAKEVCQDIPGETMPRGLYHS